MIPQLSSARPSARRSLRRARCATSSAPSERRSRPCRKLPAARPRNRPGKNSFASKRWPAKPRTKAQREEEEQLEFEHKLERDARYAARKERKKKKKSASERWG